LDLLRAAYLPRAIAVLLSRSMEKLSFWFGRLFPTRLPRREVHPPTGKVSRAFTGVLLLVVVGLLAGLLHFVLQEVGIMEVGHAALLGLATFGRVVALLLISTVIWTPIGVMVGFNPRLAHITQPIAQFLSSFPANFLFPFVTLILLRTHVSLNWGSILLMALGTQWYILFNVIAGAVSIPTDLREMSVTLGVRGWQLWRAMIIPGIFSAWVTGAITAAGGAWNASIVAEIVTWGRTTLTAAGLGQYITQATRTGDWPRIVLGVGMMSLFVVVLNRLVWRRLYTLAATRYTLA
jgi:NitT/TauT family transport system permease protein